MGNYNDRPNSQINIGQNESVQFLDLHELLWLDINLSKSSAHISIRIGYKVKRHDKGGRNSTKEFSSPVDIETANENAIFDSLNPKDVKCQSRIERNLLDNKISWNILKIQTEVEKFRMWLTKIQFGANVIFVSSLLFV